MNCDISTVNDHGHNILHVCAKNSFVEVTLKVIEHVKTLGILADLLNQTDEQGFTPLCLSEWQISYIQSDVMVPGDLDSALLVN